MSLKDIHSNLLDIKQTSSSNAKISMLAELLQNDADPCFKRVILLMYSEDKHFKVNKLSPFKKQQSNLLHKAPTNEELFAFLEKLANQKGASNADKQELSRLASIDIETYDVVKKIVNKDAKCGFGGKSINKACPDLLFLMPYCRCSTSKKMGNINYEAGAFVQEKADGMFSNNIIDRDGSSLIRSRNGNIVHQMDHIHDFFKYIPKQFRNTVYMGELLIIVNGKVLPRKTGNGYLNSCLQNAAPSDMAEHAIIKLWDAVPQHDFWKGSCTIPYDRRLARISRLAKEMNKLDLFSIIQTKKVYSLEEAERFYRLKRKEGKEGAVVKNQHALWKWHDSPDQIKLKNKSDAELRIVGWKHGKEDTKNEHILGSVQLESDDGLVKVSVSGFTDEERLLDWDERVGKVVTLEYEGLTFDKSRSDVYSLYLPQNLEMRPDRTNTDTLKDLKKR